MPRRLVPLDRLSAEDLAAWTDLAARAAEPNPFYEADFVLAAHRALRERARLLVAHDGERWIGCLPVRRLVLPGALRTWRHPYCFLGTPLLDAGSPEAAAEALGAACRMLVLEVQDQDGRVAGAIRRALEGQRLAPFYEKAHERAMLVRRPESTYLDDMKAHHRREFRRQRRRLEEELGAALEVRDVSADPAAVDRFMALEEAGWKGREGTALSSREAHATFFREVCDGFRRDGRLQMLELVAGDRLVATKCNFRAGEGVFCFKIAHDEALSRFSPGVQLEIAHVAHFHEECAALWADSCAAPDNDMINRLWPDRRSVCTLAVARGGARVALLSHGAAAARTYKTIRSRERKSPSPVSST